MKKHKCVILINVSYSSNLLWNSIITEVGIFILSIWPFATIVSLKQPRVNAAATATATPICFAVVLRTPNCMYLCREPLLSMQPHAWILVKWPELLINVDRGECNCFSVVIYFFVELPLLFLKHFMTFWITTRNVIIFIFTSQHRRDPPAISSWACPQIYVL